MANQIYETIKARVKFAADGLIPAIIQDAATKKVLTLCYMNEAALRKTLEEGFIYVFRRSQNKLMKKGETSGHVQMVKEFRLDCEGKSLLFVIDQKVAGCHKGYLSCYFEQILDSGDSVITDKPVFDPKKVY